MVPTSNDLTISFSFTLSYQGILSFLRLCPILFPRTQWKAAMWTAIVAISWVHVHTHHFPHVTPQKGSAGSSPHPWHILSLLGPKISSGNICYWTVNSKKSPAYTIDRKHLKFRGSWKVQRHFWVKYPLWVTENWEKLKCEPNLRATCNRANKSPHGTGFDVATNTGILGWKKCEVCSLWYFSLFTPLPGTTDYLPSIFPTTNLLTHPCIHPVLPFICLFI